MVPYLLIQLIVYILASMIFLKFGVAARASVILTPTVENDLTEQMRDLPS